MEKWDLYTKYREKTGADAGLFLLCFGSEGAGL